MFISYPMYTTNRFTLMLVCLVLLYCCSPLLAQQTPQSNDCPEATISPEYPGAICEQQPVLLTANTVAQASYQWLREGQPIYGANSSSLEAAMAGTYQVVINYNNCSDTSVVVIITEEEDDKPNKPVITGTSPACEGEDVQLSTGSVSGATYFWTGPDGFVSDQQNPVIPHVAAASAGEYFLEARLGKCHSETASFFLEVYTSPKPAITYNGNGLLCPGGSLLLNASHPAASGYQWYKDEQPIAGATNKIYTARQPGTYQVAILTAAQCNRMSQPVSIDHLLDAAFTVHDQVCITEVVQFVHQQADGITYFWDFGDGHTSTEANPNHTYTAAGTKQVTLRVSSADGGCTDEAAHNVEVLALPEIALIPGNTASLCPGDTLEAQVSGTYHSLSWRQGGSAATKTITQAGVYQVTAYNELGCSVIRTLTVQQEAPPVLEIVATREEITAGDSVVLSATGAARYTWYVADKLMGAKQSITVAPVSTNTYLLKGYNATGCAASDSITIRVVQTGQLQTPSLFSPNEDGIDDYWVVAGMDALGGCKLKVFNLQGNLVYQSGSRYDNTWSGTSQQGMPLPVGVYYYTLQCAGSDQQHAGSITLLR